MPKFLTTTHISAELVNLIRSAKDEIVIISPYVKVNELLQSDIDLANSRQVRFTIIYGKRDMRAEEHAWIDRLTTQETGFISNLHAKCYLNESAAIVTSMNLYEFSQQNNDEMGILATRADDPELYQQIYEEARRLGSKANLKWGMQAAPTHTPTPQRAPQPQRNEATVAVPTAPRNSRPTQGSNKRATQGFCIRCGNRIPMDRDKPLCGRCHREWVKYKNETYPEKYCHACGKQRDTTFAKPLCVDCYGSSGRS